MSATFEIYKSGDQFRFRLKAANGEIVATGESYTTKQEVERGVEAVKNAAASAEIDDLT